MSWEMVRLGDLVNIKTGKLDANASSIDGIYPFFTCSKVPLKISTFTYDCECVLIAGNGDLNVKYYKGKFDAYQRTYIVETLNSENLNVRYLYYFLDTYLEILREQSIGGVIKYIKLENLSDAKVPLPPLATQKRIAEILDAADALRRKDQELLKKYDELAQAIFIDLFGDPVKNEKGWEVKKLREICVKITDGTHFSPPNEPTGIPYITAKHLKQDYIDFYCNPTYISNKHHLEIYSRCKPIKGDVLYIKDGATTGVAAVNEYDFEFSMLSSLALIKPNKQLLNSYYLSCYLNNSIVKQELIRSYMAGAAIKRFTLDKINKFEIVLPPIKLQNTFELRWKKLQQSIIAVKNSKSEHLFNALIQKAFKGELVQ